MLTIENLIESARSAADRALEASSHVQLNQVDKELGYITAMLDQIEKAYRNEVEANTMALQALADRGIQLFATRGGNPECAF